MPRYNGERGAAFRDYKRDVLALFAGMFAKDDKYSHTECLLGMDAT